jgi:hypothetical protein
VRRIRTFAEQNDSITVAEPFPERDRGHYDRAEDPAERARSGPPRRIDAQAAGSEVEELIWQVAHFEPGKQRMVFMIDCGEPELPGAAN